MFHGYGQCSERGLLQFHIITKSMRALWLVHQLWVIVPVNPRSSELLYKSNRPQVSMNTRRIRKPLACSSWFTNSSRVLPTSRVVYQLLLFKFHRLYEFRFSDWLICTTWHWVMTKQLPWRHYRGENSIPTSSPGPFPRRFSGSGGRKKDKKFTPGIGKQYIEVVIH